MSQIRDVLVSLSLPKTHGIYRYSYPCLSRKHISRKCIVISIYNEKGNYFSSVTKNLELGHR